MLNCGALLSPQGTSALGRSLAEIAEVQLTAVRVDFQCKRQGNGRPGHTNEAVEIYYDTLENMVFTVYL